MHCNTFLQVELGKYKLGSCICFDRLPWDPPDFLEGFRLAQIIGISLGHVVNSGSVGKGSV